jgi:uncharacterized membrane protein
MATIASFSVEIMFLLLAVYCIYTLVRRKEKEYLILFFGLVAYGLALEMTTIQITQGYHYTGFLFMVGEVPLWIGCMWAVLVYTTMRTTDLLGLPEHIRPIADAVLVAAVDVAIDPVAISMGLWHWSIPGNWFGVPYANYFGWFNAVFIFSVVWRGSDFYFERMGDIIPRKSKPYVHTIVTVILATIVLSISLLVYYLNLSLRMQEILLASMYLGGAALVSLYYPRYNLKNRLDAHLVVSITVIFFIFLFVLINGIGLGAVFIAIYLIIFILSIAIRLVPFAGNRIPKEGSGAQ